MRPVTYLVLLAAVVASLRPADGVDCRTNPWPYARNTIVEGVPLTGGAVLATSTSFLSIVNGSAVIQRGPPTNPRGILWSTHTDGSGATSLALVDGNLHLQAPSGAVVWTSSGMQSASIAVLQDDCNLVLYEEAPFTNATWESGSQLCVMVHIVPHSHDDVGWLLTPERYYDGCHTPWGGVQSIISTVIDSLQNNDTRRFVQVEQYFFNRWWVRQSESTRQATIDVVRRGLLDMINGGWSMHDEACVHHESAIANMEVGAQFLKSIFGAMKNLSIGWHIDPFGHASATPRLMSQMGFDAFFFWRTDYQQRQHMLNTKTLETMWDSSPSLRDQVLMFTSIMYNGYCMGCQSSDTSGFDMCPDGFCCFSCEQEPREDYYKRVFTNPATQGWTSLNSVAKAFHLSRPEKSAVLPFNITDIALQYAQYVKDYAKAFRTHHVLIPYGCDFQHIYAPMSYSLMDAVMEAVNGNSTLGVNMFYSTPERYIREIHAMNYSWPVNSYDYFLDSDNEHSYWSGYLSSRAEYKSYERWLMNHRRAAEILLSSTAPTASFSLQWGRVQSLREALGVAQHHDSITGTEREHVRNQYQNILATAMDNVTQLYSDVFSNMTGLNGAQTCLLSNISYCEATQSLAKGGNVTVLLWNPLASPRREVITIPIPTPTVGAWIRVGSDLKAANGQVQTTWEMTTTKDPLSPPVSPMGYALLIDGNFDSMQLVEILLVGSCGAACVPRASTSSALASISNEALRVDFDSHTGYMTAITDLRTQQVTHFTADVLYYTPMTTTGQPSGAYIFRTEFPNSTATSYSNGSLAKIVVVKGTFCSEVRSVLNFSNSIHVMARLCSGQTYVDVTVGLGVIESGPLGREVVLRISTDIDSSSTWYVDSQGLEVQQRVRDSRPNYPYTPTEPVAANFFPSNQFAYLRGKSSNRSVAVIGDYTRACASLNDGQLEFLAIRRLLVDDWRGVGQPLNETIRVINRNRVLVGTANIMENVRVHSLLHAHPIVVTYAAVRYNPAPNIVGPELPPSLHLHSRFLLTPTTLILRLQHLFAVGESATLAVPVSVDIRKMMPPNALALSVVETDMNGVNALSDVNSRRLRFKVCDSATGQSRMGPTAFNSTLTGTVAVLYPMDIRTYIAELQWPKYRN